ncbi:MAG: carotenoid biosynthesis protein [Cryomorphaceae bacterium]
MTKRDNLEQFKSKKAGVTIVIILHLVGAAGYISPLSDWFVYLTPMNLLITAGMLWIDTEKNRKSAWPVALVVMVVGYLIEVIGVKTGAVFGTYAYGDVLGWKVLEVPPLIGVNWLIVIWGAFSLSFTIGVSKHFRWLTTAIFAMALDLLIEPVAVHYELWTWFGVKPPIQNYIAWFVTAAVLGAVFEKYPLVRKPRLGVVAFICQILFFGIILRAINQ